MTTRGGSGAAGRGRARPVPGGRRGFGAIAFVLLLLALLGVWAASQEFVVGSTRARVRGAEAEREALQAALALGAQGPILFGIGAAGGDAGVAEPADTSLAARIRELLPGERLELEGLPVVWDPSFSVLPVEIEEARALAWLIDVRAPPDGPPPICNCGRPEEDAARGGPRVEVSAEWERDRAGAVDCEAYGEFLDRFGDEPPLSVGRVLAQKEVLGDYRPIEMRGVVDVVVTTRVPLGRVPIRARVRTRYPFTMASSPCPDLEAARAALGFGSSVEVVPIELGRFVQVWRGEGPAPGEGS